MATSFIARHALHALEMSTGPVVESVELKGFRGIRACEEPVGLSRFTVLIGRNNAGKTSVLEALALLSVDTLSSTAQPAKWRWDELLGHLHGRPLSLVYGYTGEATIKYGIRGREVLRKIRGGSISSPRINGEEAGISGLTELLETETLGSFSVFLPNDTEFLRECELAMESESAWHEVEKSGASVSIVRDLVAKVVPDRFTEAIVRFEHIALRKELPDGRVLYVRAADLGDGVERVLIYGLWLETYRPKLVLWDDIEASAHPGLVEAVLEWLASRDWQVVLSTHSLDVLDRLVAVEPEGASVVVLRKGADDVLRPRVLGLDELREMLESHVDPRKVVDIL